jgi:hypothetical protein
MIEFISQRGLAMSHRFRNFLIMLPFFLIGIAIPVYYFGWSGDQGVVSEAPSYTSSPSSPESAPSVMPRGRDVVRASRDFFERGADRWRGPGTSRLTVQLLLLAGLFVGGYVVLRLVLAFASSLTGAANAALGFLVHKALGPMFMGFLAVGSTWGIHQTVAEQFGMTWAAVTVAVTAAVATLFALAGVRLRN